MTTIKVQLTIEAPIGTVLREFADYDHAPVLHKKYVRSVRALEQDGNVSTALWRLKVLIFWCTVRQKQTVIPPKRLINETTDGFARGTVENTYLSEKGNGTEILDIVEVRTPKWGRLIQWIVAAYTRRLVTSILLDHKLDLESRKNDSMTAKGDRK